MYALYDGITCVFTLIIIDILLLKEVVVHKYICVIYGHFNICYNSIDNLFRYILKWIFKFLKIT